MTNRPEKPMSKLEEFGRAVNLLENAKCSKGTAKDTTDKGICALVKASKFGEMAKLHKFTEEFGKKFLSTLGEEKFKTKDPYKLLKEIQKDEIWKEHWKELMKRLKKAKSYEVKKRKGDDPAMIIFKYVDGKTEKYPLELSYKKSLALAEAMLAPLKKMSAKEEQEGHQKKDLERHRDTLLGKSRMIADVKKYLLEPTSVKPKEQTDWNKKRLNRLINQIERRGNARKRNRRK